MCYRISRNALTDRLVQQDMLTVRENTRRNASSGFKPQSQYRPMLALNPERRVVRFLTRTPTASRKKQQQQRAPSPVPVGSEGKGKQRREEAEAQAPTIAPPPPSADDTIRQPSLGQLLPPVESSARPPSENNDVPQAELPVPTPPTATSSAQKPTPTPDTAPAAPAPVFRVHIQAPSPPPMAHSLTPSGSSSTLRYGYAHGHAAAAPGSSKAPPVPTLSQQPPVSTAMPPLPAGAAPPSLPAPAPSSGISSWAPAGHFSLQSSVLPVSPDRPVIMPRAKNAPWTPSGSSLSQVPLPGPSHSHAPSLAQSASSYSGNSGESMTRRGFLNALRQKPTAEAGPSQGGPSSAHGT